MANNCMMDIKLLNNDLLSELHSKARESERLRQNLDLRTTPADTSQRMLNVMEPGTKVAMGDWHSVEVHEPSTILEAKDGAYVGR